jgi:AraC-like DNA-binding protein
VDLQSAEKRDNWLGAISDPKLSKAIDIMHSDYQNSWSLETLAEAAGMSRANFALNFKKRVGITPMEYLNSWRMQIACELLQDARRSVSDVAQAVGYDSQSSFSSARIGQRRCLLRPCNLTDNILDHHEFKASESTEQGECTNVDQVDQHAGVCHDEANGRQR